VIKTNRLRGSNVKNSISRQCLGVLTLLCSSAGFAATVTITPSTLNPLPGSTFSVLVSGSGFPNTAAGDLNLTFISAVVSVNTPTLTNGIVLAPGSPFTNGVIADNPYLSGSANGIQVLAGFVVTPSGSFDAIQINFTVDPAAIPGALANIVVSDRDGWTDADTFEVIPVTYTQATVTVGGVVAAPNIVVTDEAVPTDDLQIPFGDVTVSTVATRIVTVTNSGTADLIVGTLAQIDALAAPYTLVNNGCTGAGATVSPASSCMVGVRFSPLAAGASSDSFDIPSNDPDTASVTVSMTGTGTVAAVPDITVTDSVAPNTDLLVPYGDVNVGSVVTETVTVTNNGGAALNISAVGALAAPFSIVTDGCAGQSLAPTVACTISVRYSPVATGPLPETLDISSNDPDEAIVTVALSGTGVTPIPVPNVVVTDSAAPTTDLQVPFGSITVGGSGTQTVTVTNSGNADLVLGQVATANPLAAPFGIANDTCSGNTLMPAIACTFQVVFDPVALGAANDALDIPSNDPDTATVTLSVSGTGAPVPVPDITVTDTVAPANDLIVGFGTVAVSDTENQTITVTNDGSADLVITSVVVPLAPFSVSSNLCTAASPLAPTESCTITVAFTPAAAQVYNGSVSISSDDADEGTVVVALSGTGADDILVIDGGSSALDFWSLSLLVGLPLVRRRRRQG
jgi:hypothetical protein